MPEVSASIVGRHPLLMDALAVADRCARTDYPILIVGETGTGKELLARRIHEKSSRRGSCFSVVDCTVLGTDLAVSELFGHLRGAFTGAVSDRVGTLEAADGGTIFLDEIGELQPAVQGQLLRFVQESTYRPLGSAAWRTADVRIVAATHRNLASDVESGSFREDLYHRLNVLQVHLPPLRARRTDVRLLVDYLLRDGGRANEAPRRFTEPALAVLMEHDWRGNIRELSNFVRRVLVLSDESPIGMETVLGALPASPDSTLPLSSMSYSAARQKSQESFTREYLEAALARTDGNVSKAARQSGIRRQYFQSRLSDLGIRADAFRAGKPARKSG